MPRDYTATDDRDCQGFFSPTEKVAKKGRKGVRTLPSIERENKDSLLPDTPRARHVPRTGEPIVTALYVAADLSSRMVTGHTGDLPDTLTGPLLPEEAGKKSPPAWQRLDEEGYRQLCGQLDTLDTRQFSADKRREIEKRVAVLVEWAACEGWT